jgi:hypothetical protein
MALIAGGARPADRSSRPRCARSRPLRRATAQLREVDTGSLGVRLPSRGTGDPIDLHAETLNSVLARIDAGFARCAPSAATRRTSCARR